MLTCSAWTLPHCFHSLINAQTFRRALTASVDSRAEINGVTLQWHNQFWQSVAGRCRKARLGVKLQALVLEEGAGKRGSESNSKHRFWRKVPESEARSQIPSTSFGGRFRKAKLGVKLQAMVLEEGAGKRCSECD